MEKKQKKQKNRVTRLYWLHVSTPIHTDESKTIGHTARNTTCDSGIESGSLWCQLRTYLKAGPYPTL